MIHRTANSKRVRESILATILVTVGDENQISSIELYTNWFGFDWIWFSQTEMNLQPWYILLSTEVMHACVKILGRMSFPHSVCRLYVLLGEVDPFISTLSKWQMLNAPACKQLYTCSNHHMCMYMADVPIENVKLQYWHQSYLWSCLECG